MVEQQEEKIFIGVKEIGKYINAALFGFGKGETITLVARGKNVKKAIDITAILIRDYIEDAEYKVHIDSEKFENRNISTIEIELSGIKKDKEKK